MSCNKMRAIHPGEILKEEFMIPLNLSSTKLAKSISVPTNRITSIINGTRSITGDTAIRLSLYFGTTPDFWMNLQKAYEIRKAEMDFDETIRDNILSKSISNLQNISA